MVLLEAMSRSLPCIATTVSGSGMSEFVQHGETGLLVRPGSDRELAQALRKLAAQAHGEALTQLMTAWEQRAADQVPGQQEFGRVITPAVRGTWAKSIGAAPSGDASESLLRLEMAAEVPTPAEQLEARRMLQLQLLTRRNDPSPVQTWGQDVAVLLASPHSAELARRVQAAVKVLLKP